jgi:uncharacterized membrane protein (UPF0127 family)
MEMPFHALCALLAVAFVALSSGCIQGDITGNQYQGQDSVCFRSSCFYVELAKTREEQVQGLMFREKLEQNKGMLFAFNEEGDYPFWMKNTLIPLDIIWINSNREVVFISKNAQPCGEAECLSIDPGKQAKYVLEINGGLADRTGLKPGDALDFHVQGLQ